MDGNWGNWLSWSTCSAACGGGTRSRSRLCNNPMPSNGGEPCTGSSVQSQSCNTGACISMGKILIYQRMIGVTLFCKK